MRKIFAVSGEDFSAAERPRNDTNGFRGLEMTKTPLRGLRNCHFERSEKS